MAKQLEFLETPINGLRLVTRNPFVDQRGLFSRMYCSDLYWDEESPRTVMQVNQSHTRNKGAVRGLHYQIAPFMETKVVTCVRGSVLDVAVDLRAGSSTFLQYFAVELSNSQTSLVIPEGFAHGFQALEDDSEILYLTTAKYSPEHERGLNPFDEMIGIKWPLPVSHISDKDRGAARLTPEFAGLTVEV